MSWFPWPSGSTATPVPTPVLTSASSRSIFGAATTTSSSGNPSSSAQQHAEEPPPRGGTQARPRPHPSQAYQEEDDHAVEELLTQFPPYGTTAAAASSSAEAGGGGHSIGGAAGKGASGVAPSLASALDAYTSYFSFLQHKPVDDPAASNNNRRALGDGGLEEDADDFDDNDGGFVGVYGMGTWRPASRTSRAKSSAMQKEEDEAESASPSAPLCDDWDAHEQELWKDKPKPVAAASGDPLRMTNLPSSGPTRSGHSHSHSHSHRRRPSRRVLSSLSSSLPNGPPTGSAEYASFPAVGGRMSLPAGSNGTSPGPPSNRGASTPPLSSIAQDRNHWMPDQLCKQCYHCEAPFTVFRRRHHCRLCGQVFCNACSAHFVPQPGGSHASSSSSVAGAAFAAVASAPAAGPATAAAASGPASSPNHPSGSGRGETAAATPAASQAVMIRVCQFCNEQVMKQQQQQQQTKQQPASGESAASKSALVLQPAAPSFLEPEAFLPRSNDAEATVPSRAARTSSEHLPRLVRRGERGAKGSTGKNAATQAANAAATALVQEGVRFTGSCAASQLEMVARELMRQHAPLVWDASDGPEGGRRSKTNSAWVNRLLSLATKCCATVDPNVKRRGDMLDLRPYVKIKTISGGSLDDCAYVSGILFRKTPRHRAMCREIVRPRIMVLSGGIDFHSTRSTEQHYRMASLETLFEQEDTYLDILVSKILKHKPNVLFVGRGVTGKGLELLAKAGVVVVQHVKPSLLHRIARQTGAAIITSLDHISVISGGGAAGNDALASSASNVVIGRCHRFRLVTFRDNEVWMDVEDENCRTEGSNSSTVEPADSSTPKQGHNAGAVLGPLKRRSIRAILNDPKLSNKERQAALAAIKLGQNAMEGTAAINMGLASRFVARNYILLEGCPKNLGCTVVLRGSHRTALKQVKMVFRFLVNMAYNLKLETAYFRERSVRIRPDFQPDLKFSFSTSLCVDYGAPPAMGGKKIRPWNGANESMPRLENDEFTAFDHQAILVTSVWMTDRTQCCPAEVKGIVYYSIQDVALGQFLRDSCFNLSLRCQNPNCKKSVLDHSLSFVHNDGLLKITVEELEDELPQLHGTSRVTSSGSDNVESGIAGEADRPIATWTYCSTCKRVVSPLTFLSDTTWKYSFGKFLEVFFYNRDATMNAPYAECSCKVQSSAQLYFGCGKLAARFSYDPIRPFGVFFRRYLPSDATFEKSETLRRLDLISEQSAKLFVKFDKHLERVSREARSLFNSPVNRPEHLQTVLSELNSIGSDVDETAKTLHDKITSAMESCRQQSDADSLNQALFQFPWSTRRFIFMLTSAWNERLSASGQAIVAMKKIAAASSRADGVIGQTVGDPLNDSLTECMKRLRKLNDQYARYKVSDITQVLPILPGVSELQQDGDYDDEFDDPDTSIDFADGVDADVLASRRRLLSRTASTTSSAASTPTRPKPTKSLGTRRHEVSRSENVVAPPKPTTGGAVKSAITRFFNRGGRDLDNYTVNLGVFAEGRPRLVPGVNGLVVPVGDEQLSSIIAYSLASVEYAKQFKHFNRAETTSSSEGDSTGSAQDGSTGVEGQRPDQQSSPGSDVHRQQQTGRAVEGESKAVERRMLGRSKSHIAHTYRDFDEKGQVTCKFKCTTYWATQFHAVRQVFLSRNSVKVEGDAADGNEPSEIEQSYVESLSSTAQWDASGGKSGASFSKSCDGRFVIKCISRTELQMFLDCAPAYFEYLSKAFFHGLPTVLCKIVGVYQIGIHNRLTGKRTMEQVAVMANIFYDRKITQVFDLKGSLRGRFAAQIQGSSTSREDANGPASTQSPTDTQSNRAVDAPPGHPSRKNQSEWADDAVGRDAEETAEENKDPDDSLREQGVRTLLDGDFLAFTDGRPMPLTDRAKAIFQMSILNDTLFLSIINVLDYSILIGIDEENTELVVGIIDFMRQYDILKQMERVGKSLPMVVGSEAPTIIQPPLYKQRFTNAMERYFMTVPSKWTAI